MAIKNLFNQNNNSPSDPSNVLATPKAQTKTQSNRQTPIYAKNYNNTVKTVNNKLGIDKEVKRTTDKLKTSSSEQKQSPSAIEPVNEKTSNKAQEKANKTTVNYARNNFNSDKEYERYLTENKVSLTSGNALDYINQKAKEKGVSARDYAKEMHTLTNNTLETEKLEAKAKNGELSDNDMESLNQFHAYIDKDNNIIDDDKLQSQNELYKTTIDTINNDVNKLNEQYTKGKISVEDYQNKYAQLEERWNKNQELGSYLENVNLKTGFDYYNWAKENNLDVSEFEKYAESFNDGIVERLTEDFAAATTDLLNTPVQLFDMAKSVFDKDFNMLDENNASTQMANESAKLRNYVMAGTNGAGRIGAQIVDSLMPMAVSALTGNVLGTTLGVGSKSLTSFANNFTNVSLGAQNAGQVTRQRLEEGNDVASSVVNGIAHGVITGLVEGLDAGRVASIFTGDAKNYILGTALLGKTSFGNIVKFLNATGASEGAEEVIETFADWAADNVQNMIGGVIGGENYSPVEVTQLDPSEMAQQFALAYAGALVLGAPTAIGVAVNSKKTYNAAIEARNYAESTLNSPLADEGSKRIAKLTIDAINADIEEYNQTKTPLSDGVTFENERVDSLGTFDEAMENLVQTSRLDIKDNLNQTIGVLQNLNKTETLIQKSLNDRGIDITTHDYLNLSNEAKQNVKTLMKSINNMDGKFPYEVSFDGSLNQDVNGYVKDGKIVLNPNVNTNYESVLAHEVTHTLENSKNYKTIENLIKGSNDYQSYYDKYSKLYKGVADNVDSEVMAKYIENNLGNKGLIDKLVKYDENLGYRIYEDLKSNFSSDLDTKVENAWLKSFEESKKQSRTGLQFSINEDSEGKYVSISDNIFDSNDVTRQDKLKKIDSFIKELINENAKYTYTLEENDIKKEVGVNRNTRKKLSESKGPETAIEIRGSILNNLKDIFKDVEFSHEDNKKINGVDTNRPVSIGENGFDKGTIRIVDPVGGKEYVATITISNQTNSNYLYSIFSKEKEGAGRTVSDIGPRDNPKAPSYLNDTSISEKSNIQNANTFNEVESGIAEPTYRTVEIPAYNEQGKVSEGAKTIYLNKM